MLKSNGSSGRKPKQTFLAYIITRFRISPKSYPEIYKTMGVTRSAWAAWLHWRNRMSVDSLEALRAALEVSHEEFYEAYALWLKEGKKNP